MATPVERTRRQVVEVLERRVLLAAQLLKDVNTDRTTATFVPSALAAGPGSVAYFADHDGTTGDELWRTDGTAAGTNLVKDIFAGPAGSFPGYFTTLGSVTYFNAGDAASGAELWRTDGTAAGTFRVADINPGVASSGPSDLTAFNGLLYFFANDGVHGRELWRSDGTAAGTTLVVDTYAGSGGQGSVFYGARMTVANGNLVFYASDGSNVNVYVTTGAVGNETSLKSFANGISSTGLLPATGKAFFVDALGYVYQTDGTAAGTVVDDQTNASVYSPTVAGGYLYYSRVNGLYCVGGGTRRVVTGGFSGPALVGAGGGLAYFSATNTATGHPSLWHVNTGGFGGTLVADNVAAAAGGAAAGGFAFTAGSAATGYTLNYTDGTTADTRSLGTVNAGGSLPTPTSLTGFAGTKLLFVNADAANGVQPWVSDLATAAGTGLLKAIYPGTGFAYPFLFNTPVNNRLVFQATDATTGQELWATDGTTAGTVQLKDIYPGPGNGHPNAPVTVGNRIYFSAYDPTDGYALWSTDGTAAGTAIVPGTANTSATAIGSVNGVVLFTATDAAHGNELWRTDGTTSQLLDDINPGASSSSPYNGITLNGVYYFAATDAAHGTELWRTDGTTAGTSLVADVYPGASSSGVGNGLFAFNNRVLFSAEASTSTGYELWSTDGTAAGTALVKDLYPGSSSGSPTSFAAYNGLAYFAAKDSTGTGLWSTDGTAAGTARVAAAVSPSRLTPMNGRLYFVGGDGVHAGALFATSGTAATTGPVNPTDPTSISGGLTVVGGRLFFTAMDAAGQYGSELWSSDGTAAGTAIVQDLFAGFPPGASGTAVGFNGSAYFTGNDGVVGSEVFKLPDTFPPTTYAATATVAGGTVAPHAIRFWFSENVAAGLSAASLQLTDLTTGAAVPTATTGYSYDPTTNTATFALPDAALADGRYRATIPAASIVDPAGNRAAADATAEFAAVAGTAGNDAIGVQPSADGTAVVLTRGGAAALTTPSANLGAIVVTGGGGDDALTVAAAALRPAGLSYDGGTGTNTLAVVGAVGAHSVATSAAGLTYDTIPVVAASTTGPLTFDPAGGVDALTVAAATAFPSAPAGTARALSLLNVTAGGTLDLAGNDLDVAGGSLATVTTLVAAGYANGTWAGTGLTSATAAADPRHLAAVGVVQNNQGGAPLFSAANPFDGTVPGTTDVLVKSTVYGDANLDGQVDGRDYVRLDAGYVSQTTANKLTGWYNGDFNDDGKIDGSDYTLIDNAFNLGARPAAQLAAAVASSTARIAEAVGRPERPTAFVPFSQVPIAEGDGRRAGGGRGKSVAATIV